MNTLQIGPNAYVVTTSTFDPYYSEFSDCLIWGLEVVCEGGPLKVGATLSVDCAWATHSGEPSDWTAAIGRIQRWDTRAQSAEAPAFLYLCEHTPIEVGELAIVAVDSRLEVRFSGTCDLSYEELTEETPVCATIQPASWGIRVSTADEAYARRILGPFVDLGSFRLEQDEEGLRFVSGSYT